jgi:hypothetical protein
MRLPLRINPDDTYIVSAWRRLAVAKRITAERHNEAAFNSIYRSGLALRHSNGETGKYERFTYVLSTLAEEWLAANGKRPTLAEALEKMGAAAVTTAKRRWSAQQAVARRHIRSFPTIKEVAHMLLIEAQGPLVSYNDDGEFSSPGLTQWYVARFCALNNLKP